MQDLTSGSITHHLLKTAGFMLVTMIFQTLYLLVDLYFVASLGDAAIAGVGAAGTIMFVVMALTQVLGVGAVALISQAVGRKERSEANLVFNQSMVLSDVFAIVTLILGYTVATMYVGSITADEAARSEGVTFMRFFLPGLALQFALVTMGSALRATAAACRMIQSCMSSTPSAARGILAAQSAAASVDAFHQKPGAPAQQRHPEHQQRIGDPPVDPAGHHGPFRHPADARDARGCAVRRPGLAVRGQVGWLPGRSRHR